MPSRSTPPIVAHGFVPGFVSAFALVCVLAGCALEPLSMPPASVASSPATGVTTALTAEPATGSAEPTASVEPTVPLVLAVIGDYGTNDSHAAEVASLVASWEPSFVFTTGDDYYRRAGGTGSSRYRRSTGAYYGTWVRERRFYPSLGNHDYTDATPSPKTYLSYFKLPGNERYYDVVQGPVHLFILNSNRQEPSGRSSSSKQARWLRKALAASQSQFKLVVDHHPPYSSDNKHGSTTVMRWPFARWGADMVLSGHAHTYERIERNGISYVVNGLGGASRYGFAKPLRGSVRRYRSNWGALKLTVAEDTLEGEFYSVRGTLVDTFTVSGASVTRP